MYIWSHWHPEVLWNYWRVLIKALGPHRTHVDDLKVGRKGETRHESSKWLQVGKCDMYSKIVLHQSHGYHSPESRMQIWGDERILESKIRSLIFSSLCQRLPWDLDKVDSQSGGMFHAIQEMSSESGIWTTLTTLKFLFFVSKLPVDAEAWERNCCIHN